MAALCAAIGTTVFQVRAVRDGRLGFIPKWDGLRLQRRIFREILQVGVLGSMTTLMANLTAVLMVGLQDASAWLRSRVMASRPGSNI